MQRPLEEPAHAVGRAERSCCSPEQPCPALSRQPLNSYRLFWGFRLSAQPSVFPPSVSLLPPALPRPLARCREPRELHSQGQHRGGFVHRPLAGGSIHAGTTRHKGAAPAQQCSSRRPCPEIVHCGNYEGSGDKTLDRYRNTECPGRALHSRQV